jgi:hypothetical protein
MEYFCNEGDELWVMSDEDLVELGTAEIDKIGLAKRASVVDGCVFRVEKSYPVYDAAYGDHLEVIREFVESLDNFQTIGRNGLHRYNNQDHAMLTGMYAVRNAVSSEEHCLWSVNTEQEYHEEVKGDGPGRNKSYVEVSTDLGFASVLRALDRVAFGAASSVVSGLILSLMTLVLVIQGGPQTGATLGLLRNYLPGYEVSSLGSLIGLAYGCMLGFGVGWLAALLRNGIWFLYFSLVRRRAERGFLRDLLDHI